MADRRGIAIKTLKQFAKHNNIAAIVALIEEGIDVEHYLDQLCAMTEPGSVDGFDIDEDMDIGNRILAARKLLKLQKEESEEKLDRSVLSKIRMNNG